MEMAALVRLDFPLAVIVVAAVIAVAVAVVDELEGLFVVAA